MKTLCAVHCFRSNEFPRLGSFSASFGKKSFDEMVFQVI